LNPSNIGITTTLLLFPSVGIAPPYQFTENLFGAGDWVLPGIILVSGSLLNAAITQRIPLIASWIGGFAVQALVRRAVTGAVLASSLAPMTGVAFLLYTFYMVTDPSTTPNTARHQLLFGFGVATAYGVLLALHVVFGFFFALSFVCAVRGAAAYAAEYVSAGRRVQVGADNAQRVGVA
jgi:Na+-translocating ferredoxin:NAD+ oxidoreductase RnfD subunit